MDTTMNNIPERRGARFASLIGVIAAGLLSATAFAAPAAAFETGPNIDPDQTGSILLHKFAQPETPTGLPNDGSELTPDQLAGLTPLEGVTFTLRGVGNIDLTTNEGWDAVNGLTAAEVLADPATYPLTDSGAGATDAAGDLAFPALPVGVYLVTETDPGDNPIAQPAAPFLVTIPMPTGENTWLYDVNVYPKNAVTEVAKTVDDSAAFGLGDIVDWDITGQVPYLTAGSPLGAFAIRDALDPRLGYESATVTALTAGGDPLPLLATDYTMTTPSPVGASGTVEAVFTTEGLAKLEANQGAVVTMELGTRVLSIGDGSIENLASLAINDSVNSAEAVSNWGALEIFKYATVDGADERLAGAQFQIFTSADDAATRTDPVAVDGETTFTSTSTANIAIDGLNVGDYWIVETVAPTGYVANTTPIPVTIVQGSTDDAVLVEVENTQVPAWLLPLTGGSGASLFGIFGGAAIVLAIGAALVINSRRKVRVTA
jgi:fimbrial isopeptide formation D2 family protein/LPXTG-motif cell wall-anchored protein